MTCRLCPEDGSGCVACEARARHLARPALPMGYTRPFPDMRDRIYLAGWNEGTVHGKLAWFTINGGCSVWLHESDRANPAVQFGDANPSFCGRRLPGAAMRFALGNGDWLVRVAQSQSGLYVSLPTSPEADQYIVWWREETPEEWLGDPAVYEHFTETMEARETMPVAGFTTDEASLARLRAAGWEVAQDFTNGMILARRQRHV